VLVLRLLDDHTQVTCDQKLADSQLSYLRHGQ